MAGVSPIVTDGFLFTPSLIVTAGFMSGSGPTPPAPGGETDRVRVGIVRGDYVTDNPSIGGQF